MRTQIVTSGAKNIKYEIREIVDYGTLLQNNFGIEMTWENIGDPIAMGEVIPEWMRETVKELINKDSSWGYCPSKGVLSSREFLAAEINKRGGVQVTADDILFTNGVADAVEKIYDLIRKDARVLMQSPSYSTHPSNEAKRGDYAKLLFNLDPYNDWQPDLEEIENKVKYNPQIIAIALINPDNPSGTVYRKEVMKGIVDIARKYRLFIICDEIYAHIVYNGREPYHLSEIIEDVPALSLRGVSKDYPWPGSRCGWIEMLNRTVDKEFESYCQTLVSAKMIEVCSTTLPQLSVPLIYGNPLYAKHMKTRADNFARRSNEFYEFFKDVKGVEVNRTYGAFYFCVRFPKGLLTDKQTLPIANPEARRFVEEKVANVALDKRFVYYLMASAGICVTPLSGFFCDLDGFRLTTLRADDNKRKSVLERLQVAIESYLQS